MQVTRQLQAHVNLFSKTEFNSYFMQITCIFIVYYLLFLPTNAYIYIYIKIFNYIESASTYFGASAPSSGSFDIAFDKVINYWN